MGLGLSDNYLQKIVSCIISAVPTDSVYIFGSFARGEETANSDLDIYVVTKDSEENRFESAGKIGRALLWMNMPKDIIANSSSRFNERRNSLSNIEYTVAREGVKIYG